MKSNSLQRSFYKSVNFTKRNAGSILATVGTTGMFVSTIMAVGVTPKAVSLMMVDKYAQLHNENRDGFVYSWRDVMRSSWRCYVPAALVGLTSASCIFGAIVLTNKQNASLVSSYAFLDNAFKQYRLKTDELFGPGADLRVRTELAKSKYSDFESTDSDDAILFYDQYSERYFERSKETVILAEYNLNRDLVLKNEVTLNDFYELLDLPPTELGSKIGWSYEVIGAFYRYGWIDFEHETVTMFDDVECTIINMPFSPTADFRDG